MPDCNCTEVALNFFEKVHRIRITKQDFSFLYDYINKTIREPIGIEEKDVIGIFTDELNKKFKEKHKELKEEIYPYIEEKIKDYKKDYPKRKLGRNEPCHCGSGKKYKKCCLLKDIEKYRKAIKI